MTHNRGIPKFWFVEEDVPVRKNESGAGVAVSRRRFPRRPSILLAPGWVSWVDVELKLKGWMLFWGHCLVKAFHWEGIRGTNIVDPCSSEDEARFAVIFGGRDGVVPVYTCIFWRSEGVERCSSVYTGIGRGSSTVSVCGVFFASLVVNTGSSTTHSASSEWVIVGVPSVRMTSSAEDSSWILSVGHVESWLRCSGDFSSLSIGIISSVWTDCIAEIFPNSGWASSVWISELPDTSAVCWALW